MKLENGSFSNPEIKISQALTQAQVFEESGKVEDLEPIIECMFDANCPFETRESLCEIICNLEKSGYKLSEDKEFQEAVSRNFVERKIKEGESEVLSKIFGHIDFPVVENFPEEKLVSLYVNKKKKHEEDEDVSYLEVISDGSTVEGEYDKDETVEIISQALVGVLNDNELESLKMFSGLYDEGEMDFKEIGAKLGVKENKAKQYVEVAISKSKDLMEKHGVYKLDDLADQVEKKKKIKEQALAKLPNREREFLVLRQGYDGKGKRSLREVKQIMGLSKKEASRVQTYALESLRHNILDLSMGASLETLYFDL